MSTTPGGPTPGTGAIVQFGPNGPKKTIASGRIFPTGMTVGRDGAFYVSEQGFGFGAGEGRVLRITGYLISAPPGPALSGWPGWLLIPR